MRSDKPRLGLACRSEVWCRVAALAWLTTPSQWRRVDRGRARCHTGRRCRTVRTRRSPPAWATAGSSSSPSPPAGRCPTSCRTPPKSPPHANSPACRFAAPDQHFSATVLRRSALVPPSPRGAAPGPSAYLTIGEMLNFKGFGHGLPMEIVMDHLLTGGGPDGMDASRSSLSRWYVATNRARGRTSTRRSWTCSRAICRQRTGGSALPGDVRAGTLRGAATRAVVRGDWQDCGHECHSCHSATADRRCRDLSPTGSAGPHGDPPAPPPWCADVARQLDRRAAAVAR